MRLRYIWSMRGFTLRERFARTRDAIFWKLPDFLPLRLRYITTMRELAKVTTMPKNGHKAVPDFTMTEILQDLEAPKKMA